MYSFKRFQTSAHNTNRVSRAVYVPQNILDSPQCHEFFFHNLARLFIMCRNERDKFYSSFCGSTYSTPVYLDPLADWRIAVLFLSWGCYIPRTLTGPCAINVLSPFASVDIQLSPHALGGDRKKSDIDSENNCEFSHSGTGQTRGWW